MTGGRAAAWAHRLSAGATFEGPAVFEEHESTFVVGFGAEIRVDPALNLIAELSSV